MAQGGTKGIDTPSRRCLSDCQDLLAYVLVSTLVVEEYTASRVEAASTQQISQRFK